MARNHHYQFQQEARRSISLEGKFQRLQLGLRKVKIQLGLSTVKILRRHNNAEVGSLTRLKAWWWTKWHKKTLIDAA